jgi:uncharacterized protein YcfL
MKKIIILFLLVLFVTGCNSSEITNKVGDQGYAITLESFDGNKVSLEDYRGKTVYLFAWTTT